MKLKTQIAVLAVLALPFSFVNAKEKAAKKAAAPAAAAVANGTYKVDVSQTKINWLAKKVTGQHNGTIGVKSGDLNVLDGALTGGKIIIDPATISAEDLTGEAKGKLEGHLKSDDFFGVATNPEIVFELTKIEPVAADSANVTGNLTIKGKTNPITFPAKVSVAADKVTASATGITVDRTLFDIRYGSGKFFKGLGDKVINDQFWLDVNLVAVK